MTTKTIQNKQTHLLRHFSLELGKLVIPM